MFKFLWTLFVFLAVWAAVGFIGAMFLHPAISFGGGFFLGVWAGSKA